MESIIDIIYYFLFLSMLFLLKDIFRIKLLPFGYALIKLIQYLLGK